MNMGVGVQMLSPQLHPSAVIACLQFLSIAYHHQDKLLREASLPVVSLPKSSECFFLLLCISKAINSNSFVKVAESFAWWANLETPMSLPHHG